MPQSIAEAFSSIPMSSNLGDSLERGHRFAREQSHRLVTLEHLLLALSEDPEASLILEAANVDLGRLRGDVSGYLGRLMEDMRAEPGQEPRPDPELLRVLQAAASAAQQSKRRQIDGAIVLAAIVGDGKSPAAGLLKSHGMTFEEAIRALQRANTQARLKTPTKTAAPAQASAGPAAASTDQGAAQSETTAPPHAAQPAALPPEEPAASAPPHSSSADEFLAAARARIQQRAATAAARAESHDDSIDPGARPAAASAPAHAAQKSALLRDRMAEVAGEMNGLLAEEAPAPGEPSAEAPLQPAQAAPPEPPQTAPEGQIAPPAPEVQHIQAPPRQSWTPPPQTRPQANARLPQPPQGRAMPPFQARPLKPGEGPPRPPLPPQRAGRPGQPPPGYPDRSAKAAPAKAPSKAPWPEPGERARAPRGPAANGSLPGGQFPALEPTGPMAAPQPGRAPTTRAGGQADRGPLVESVPRRMRAGKPSSAEVRIARDKIDGLIQALNSRGGPHRPDAVVTRALTVRLKAPNGGFWIDAASPETQWVDSSPALIHDEYVTWRWAVTPRRSGRGRLQLVVSARTVGQDGIAAETAPPDRVIDVRVRGNYLRQTARWTFWIAALLIAAALGRFGEEIWEAASLVVMKAIAG